MELKEADLTHITNCIVDKGRGWMQQLPTQVGRRPRHEVLAFIVSNPLICPGCLCSITEQKRWKEGRRALANSKHRWTPCFPSAHSRMLEIHVPSSSVFTNGRILLKGYKGMIAIRMSKSWPNKRLQRVFVWQWLCMGLHYPSVPCRHLLGVVRNPAWPGLTEDVALAASCTSARRHLAVSASLCNSWGSQPLKQTTDYSFWQPNFSFIAVRTSIIVVGL